MNNICLEKYGIRLKPLSHDNIEEVRQWRNNPKIQQYMVYKQEITKEMQESWFQKISKSDSDFYYIIEYDGKNIGMINIKDIDWDQKTGEGGIFIWDDQYLNSDVSFRASLCLQDFVFENLKLDSMYAHILASNKRAIQYAKVRGYKLRQTQESQSLLTFQLNKDDYAVFRDRIIKTFKW